MSRYSITDREAEMLNSLNDLCTIFFLGEACVKIAGFGWTGDVQTDRAAALMRSPQCRAEWHS